VKFLSIGIRGGGGEQKLPELENFQGKLCFTASASCSKILNDKKYILNAVNSQHTVFQGKRKLLKNPECRKYIQYSEKFQGKLCFSGQAQVAEKS